jgi:hypothetical protein
MVHISEEAATSPWIVLWNTLNNGLHQLQRPKSRCPHVHILVSSRHKTERAFPQKEDGIYTDAYPTSTGITALHDERIFFHCIQILAAAPILFRNIIKKSRVESQTSVPFVAIQ